MHVCHTGFKTACLAGFAPTVQLGGVPYLDLIPLVEFLVIGGTSPWLGANPALLSTPYREGSYPAR